MGGKATPKRGIWHCQLIFGAPARTLPEPSNNKSSHASLYVSGGPVGPKPRVQQSLLLELPRVHNLSKGCSALW